MWPGGHWSRLLSWSTSYSVYGFSTGWPSEHQYFAIFLCCIEIHWQGHNQWRWVWLHFIFSPHLMSKIQSHSTRQFIYCYFQERCLFIVRLVEIVLKSIRVFAFIFFVEKKNNCIGFLFCRFRWEYLGRQHVPFLIWWYVARWQRQMLFVPFDCTVPSIRMTVFASNCLTSATNCNERSATLLDIIKFFRYCIQFSLIDCESVKIFVPLFRIEKSNVCLSVSVEEINQRKKYKWFVKTKQKKNGALQ